MEKINIYLDKEIIDKGFDRPIKEEIEFTNEMFLVYIGIRKGLPKDGMMYINNSILAHMTFGTFETTNYFKKAFEVGLEQLISKGYIQALDGDKKVGYYINATNLLIDNEKHTKAYFILSNDEFMKLYELASKVKNKVGFIRYAIALLSSIHTKNLYGAKTYDHFERVTKLYKQAIISYNKILEEEKIIYIYRNKYLSRKKDGSINRASNTYSRFKDKEKCITASEEYNNTYMFDDTKKVNKNKEKNPF